MATRVVLAANSLTMRDFSDRELLHSMADEASENGTAGGPILARALAVRLFGLDAESEDLQAQAIVSYYTKCVTARMSWMRRFGFVEKGENKGEWLLSPVGNEMRRASLPRRVQDAVDDAQETHALALANVVGEKMVGSGDTAAHAMRRELLFQIERRRRGAR